MRTWRNINFNSEEYRITGGGIISNLQNFKDVEHKAWKWLFKTFGEFTSHRNEEFYNKHGLTKSGDGPGCKFIGPKIRHLLREDTLKKLKDIIPEIEKPLIFTSKA